METDGGASQDVWFQVAFVEREGYQTARTKLSRPYLHTSPARYTSISRGGNFLVSFILWRPKKGKCFIETLELNDEKGNLRVDTLGARNAYKFLPHIM